MEIKKSENFQIIVVDDGGKIKTQSVEAWILLAILEKLEDIRCCIIDVEDAVNHNNH